MSFDLESAPAPTASMPPAGASRVRRQLRTAFEARAKRRRIFIYALFALSCGLMVDSLVGENGYLTTLRVRREASALAASLEKVHEENQQLIADIKAIETDPSTLEDAARHTLGLAKPGETLVLIVPASPAPPAPSAPKR